MDKSLHQALLEAIESGNGPLTQQLLGQGANPNARGRHTTLLHTAILLQQKAVVRALLEGGADAQRPDTEGLYPLHIAASEGQTAMVNALLKHGALLRQATPTGSTALDLAAASNRAATARALVQAGADLEAANQAGNTPLLTACTLGNVGVVKTLLQLGANPRATNRKGQTALLLALWGVHHAALEEWSHTLEAEGRTVHYYIRRGGLYQVMDYTASQPQAGQILSLSDQRQVALATWGPTLHLNYLEALATAKYLIQEGSTLNEQDDRGTTPLHLACYIGEGRLIELLHRAGVALHPTPWNGGRRELHQVAASQRLDGLRAFLRCYGGAHSNAPDDKGWTPAHYLGDAGGPVEMAELLGQHGADPSLETQTAHPPFEAGTTAARMAFHWKDYDLAMALDEMGV